MLSNIHRPSWLLILVTGFLLNACGEPEITSTSIGSSSSEETAKVDPTSFFHKPVLDLLDQQMSEPVRKRQVANVAYLLSKDGQRVVTNYHGTRQLEGDEPVDDQTIYRIYSMTKPVTAVALMMLHEEGRFDLEDPVTRFLPELETMEVYVGTDLEGKAKTRPARRAATMKELLTHTAGFAYDDGRRDPVSQLYASADLTGAATSDEYIRRISQLPLLYDPGDAWAYSVSSDLQGIIIERITGKRLGDFMQARIFGPLKMEDTGFTVSDDQAARLAVLTSWTSESSSQALTGSIQTYHPGEVGRHAGGHGLVSTLADFERFALMLLMEGSLDGEQLLKPETIELMRQNAVLFTDPRTGLPSGGPSAGVGYGFGVGVVTDRISSRLSAPEGTYFWDGATGTWFWVDPANGIVFIGMLQNLSASPVYLRPAAMQRVYQSLLKDNSRQFAAPGSIASQ